MMLRKPLLAAILCALMAVSPTSWAQEYKDSLGTKVPGVVPIPATIGGTTSLSVTTASGAVALPAADNLYPSINLTNNGAVGLYYALGATATTSSAYLGAGASACIAAGSATQIAAITGSSTATLQVAQSNSCIYAQNGGGGSGGGGSGTVTSVGWVGGIVSIGSPTTTPAFTIAGTSGGIPYFSSTSTWASSGLLAANALMIGGGAGTAPSTTTTGTGVLTALGVNIGSAGAFVVNGGALGTPSSGVATNLTGLVYTALPALSANQVLGALTATTPSGLSLPSCSTGSSALTWTTATGFGCNTISGAGTVTSVGWTGGIVSIATATTTPAFTIAGTSGGLVYFNSASTWASSALLASGSIMTGGGAGGAPSTVTLGGDCTFSTPNITCTKIGGVALTLGAALTTTGAGAATLAFSASPATYTFPTTSATIPRASNSIQFSVLAKANSAVFFGAGSGYVTNDTITMATTGGTCSTAPIFTVTASGGAITALAVQTAGSCTVLPTNIPATQGSTSGSGTAGTFIVTWGALTQTYTPTAGAVDFQVWGLGAAGGGGSGSAETASVATSGGGGGGGGALAYGHFNATQISGAQTITIGIGGIPVAPPVATSLAAGTNGKVGSSTTFGSFLTAYAGGGGAGGQLAATASGGGGGGGANGVGGSSTSGSQGTAGTIGGAAGGASPTNTFGGAGGGTSTTAGAAGNGFQAGGGGVGGGSGGGLTSASATASGGAGAAASSSGMLTPAATSGGTANNPGTGGSNPSVMYAQVMAGSGGSGGGSAATQTTAGNGACGANGSGGGGGGDVVVGSSSVAGWGACGGNGMITIVESF